jgi:hypothetical protein
LSPFSGVRCQRGRNVQPKKKDHTTTILSLCAFKKNIGVSKLASFFSWYIKILLKAKRGLSHKNFFRKGENSFYIKGGRNVWPKQKHLRKTGKRILPGGFPQGRNFKRTETLSKVFKPVKKIKHSGYKCGPKCQLK